MSAAEPEAAYELYASLLGARGLAPGDVEVILRQAKELPAPHGVGEELVPFLERRLSREERETILTAAAEVHAHGPTGLFAEGWRLLYVGGCPLDHVWRTLWHAFKDPEADPQDFVWLPEEEALRNVRRYAELGFPRSGAPDTYGPGLGCETLLTNTRDGSRALLQHGAPLLFVARSINACRDVLTPALRAVVDREAGIDPAEVVARPSRGRLDAVRAKLFARSELTDDDLRDAVWLTDHRDRDELLDLREERVESLVGRWFSTVDALLASGRMVVDHGRDRFRLAEEPAAPLRVVRRDQPAAPTPAPALLETTLARWHRTTDQGYFGASATAQGLLEEDPVIWLGEVAEMATYGGEDEMGRIIVLPPR